jgi:hypothetical protein
MSQPDQSQVRTRMFARAFGPFFLIVPSIIAVRASSQMPVLLREFSTDPMWQWVLGAVLLMWGSVIIAFHQFGEVSQQFWCRYWGGFSPSAGYSS